MPRNSRPGILFDPIHGGRPLNEIENAQNQWDLLEAQEKANELAKEANKLEEERIEELKRQQERAEQQAEYEKNIKSILAYAKALSDKNEEYCNKVGLDIDNVIAFIDSFYHNNEQITNLIKQIEYLKEKIDNSIKNDYPGEDPDTSKYDEAIDKAESQIEKLSKNIVSRLLNRAKIEELKANIVEWKQEIEELKKDYNTERPQLIENFNNKIEIYEDQANDLEEQLNKITEQSNARKEDFNEFRKNHYNVDVETVFRQLGFKVDPIKPSEATKEGTVEDYKNYINKKLLED
jgi:chromosome segregation ATPase